MIEHNGDGFFSIGEDWRYSFVSEEGARLADRPGDDLDGELVWDTFPELKESPFGRVLRTSMKSRESAHLESYYPPHDAWYDVNVYPTDGGISVYFRDVTKTRERSNQFEAIFNNTYTLLGLLDPDGTVLEINETALELIGGNRETVIGYPLWEFDPFWMDQEARTTARDAVDRARCGEQVQEEIRLHRSDRDTVFHITVRPVTSEEGEVTHLIFEGRDITEQVILTQELQRERDFVETALDTLDDVFYVVGTDGGLRRWNSSFSVVTGYSADAISDMQAVDFFPADDAEPISAAIDETLETGDAVVEADFLTADGEQIPYQFTGARLSDTEGNLIGLVGIGRDISEKKRRQQELRQQRERLEALNSLNMIFRDITDDVIEQSTREEIEQTACAKLAESNSYTFAWIADTDSQIRKMRTGTEMAGRNSNRSECQSALTHLFEESPVSTTFKTGEICVSQDVCKDPDFASWSDVRRECGFRSFITVPISHNETQFGVLGIHSERTGAFNQKERDIIEQFGDIIGYVFFAIERTEMLGSALELKFRSEQLASFFPEHKAETGDLTLEAVVPLEDGENGFVEYWEINANYVDEFRNFVERNESKRKPRLLGIVEGTAQLDVSAKAGSMSSVFAEQGGTLHTASLENNAIQMVGEFPETIEPKMVSNALRGWFPDIELISRKRVLTPQYLRKSVNENLTDRQKTVLQIAHFGGYFDHPRRSTGEELAANLGITKQTFHHHLRKAESTMCHVLFDEPHEPFI